MAKRKATQQQAQPNPASTATKKPKSSGGKLKDKQTRDWQKISYLIKELGFDHEQTFARWHESKLFKPWYDRYEAQWLKSKKKRGRKGPEFEHVYLHMQRGELDGQRAFSQPNPETSDWDARDWQAWLLFTLVRENSEDRNGCFYKKSLSWQEQCQKMWYMILRDAWRKYRKVSDIEELSVDEEDEEAYGERQPDATKGVVRVLWDNIPSNIEDSGQPSSQTIRQFGSFESLRAFMTVVTKEFKLAEYQQVIDSYEWPDDLDNDNFVVLQLQVEDADPNKRRRFLFRTREATLPEEYEEVPTSILDENVAKEVRRIAYKEMVLEARDGEANRLDLSVRLWQYNIMRNASLSFTERDRNVSIHNLQLRFDPDKDAEALITAYTKQVADFNKRLLKSSTKESDDVENLVPYGTELHEITAEEIKRYRDQMTWLDNVAYQRQDHAGACQRLGVLNPEQPRIEGMSASAEFRFWQPTGVDALREFEDGPNAGALLSDEVGTGKTIEVEGLLLYRSNERRSKAARGQPVGGAFPTLIIMPPNLIQQWQNALLVFSDRFEVVIYYGPVKKATNRVSYIKQLTQSDKLFNGDKENADKIILSSYPTFGIRHGPRAQREWQIQEYMKEHHATKKQAIEAFSNKPMNELDPDWPGNLSGRVRRIILDEAHEIRNMPAQIGTAIVWVKAPFRIGMTATPVLNGIEELAAIFQFIENPRFHSADYLESLGFVGIPNDVHDPLEYILEDFDPWTVPETNPTAQLRCTGQALTRWVFYAELTMAEKASKVASVLRQTMLKRSYASTVNNKRIGDDLPPVQRITLLCDYDRASREREFHDNAYTDAAKHLVAKDSVKDDVVWNSNIYRQLSLITSWPYFRFLKDYKAKDLKKFRETKGDALRMIRDARKGQLAAPFKMSTDRAIQAPDATHIEQILKIHSYGSPKLRQLFGLLAEIVILMKEKVTIWVLYPAQMEWLYCILRLLSIDVAQLGAHLAPLDRNTLMDDFHTLPGKVQVLICSYAVGSAGINMHGYCRTVIEFEPAPNEAIRKQVVGRVQRVGQKKWIRHICLLAKNSFNTRQAASSILRNLPNLMTQLNLEVWGKDDETSGDNSYSLGPHVLFKGEIYRSDDPAIFGEDVKRLSSDELLLAIQTALSGEKTYGDLKRMQDKAGINPLEVGLGGDSDSDEIFGPAMVSEADKDSREADKNARKEAKKAKKAAEEAKNAKIKELEEEIEALKKRG